MNMKFSPQSTLDIDADCIIGIVGLGHSGIASARWLARHGLRVILFDAQEHLDLFPHFENAPPGEIRLGTFHDKTFAECDILVVSPGISIRQPVLQNFVARGGKIVGDVELFARVARFLPSKIIAISGSNGKSTVTELCGHLARHCGWKTAIAGNIGLPVLECLLDWENRDDWPDVFVLELSSFQLETTHSLNATAATVLNISEDHLNRYHDLLDYAHSKSTIFHGDGIQVLNRDDKFVCAMERAGREIYTFSQHQAADYRITHRNGENWLSVDGIALFNFKDFRPAGLHNATNALAALALCEACGLPREQLLDGLRTFKGLPHRVEWVEHINGVDFYDDSKGTNVGATVAALQGSTRSVVIILGGDGKGQDFSPLKPALAHIGRAAILIGRDAARIKHDIEGALPIETADTLEAATQRAFELAQNGDVVLLSPACASLDMFKNYAHRAEVFINEVRRLAALHAASSS